MNKLISLAIDTTFDDTSIACLKGKHELLSNAVLSQYADHQEFGGVVPERASRKHLEVIHFLIEETLIKAGLNLSDLNFISVSNKPGLMGSLLVGLSTAKALAYSLNIPLVAVNHVEAHPYGNFLTFKEIQFPMIQLIAAGGHTILYLAKSHFDFEVIGHSIDDAAGECVDKVAKMFGYPMPGGAYVDKCAIKYTKPQFKFVVPMRGSGDLNFSFSGLKTSMLRFLQKNPTAIEQKEEVLAGFFDSLSQSLIEKTIQAAKQYQANTITISGGLTASEALREKFKVAANNNGLNIYHAPQWLCTDNAAMIACRGAYLYENKGADYFKDNTFNLKAQANI